MTELNILRMVIEDIETGVKNNEDYVGNFTKEQIVEELLTNYNIELNGIINKLERLEKNIVNKGLISKWCSLYETYMDDFNKYNVKYEKERAVYKNNEVFEVARMKNILQWLYKDNVTRLVIDVCLDVIALEEDLKISKGKGEEEYWECYHCKKEYKGSEQLLSYDPWESYGDICKRCEEEVNEEVYKYLKENDYACVNGCCVCCGCICNR